MTHACRRQRWNEGTAHGVFHHFPLPSVASSPEILCVGQVQKRELFRQFTLNFHQRWDDSKNDDVDIQLFSNKRQQSAAEIEARHQIIRQIFFDYAKANGRILTTKDTKRGRSVKGSGLLFIARGKRPLL